MWSRPHTSTAFVEHTFAAGVGLFAVPTMHDWLGVCVDGLGRNDCAHGAGALGAAARIDRVRFGFGVGALQDNTAFVAHVGNGLGVRCHRVEPCNL